MRRAIFPVMTVKIMVMVATITRLIGGKYRVKTMARTLTPHRNVIGILITAVMNQQIVTLYGVIKINF